MAGKTSSALRLTRLQLTNWRNFRDAEVRLSTRAFFVGPNASGKSNLLDAVRFLADLVRPVGGGLRAAVDERGSVSAIRCLSARRTPYVEIQADVGTDDDPNLWRYRLRFNSLKVSKAKVPIVLEEEVLRKGHAEAVQQQKYTERGGDALTFSQTLIEQVAQNREFRELAQFFASIRYLHVVPQIVRDPQRARKEGEDPFGGDLLRRMKEMPKKSRTARLNAIAKALSVAVPQFQSLELRDDTEGRPHLHASYVHWRYNPTMQSEETFSDGTLRLIGFLWSVGEKGGPLLLEEPELSLHDAVASQLPEMIHRAQRFSHRQVLATTHSAALLESKGIGLDEVHRLIPGDNGTIIETASENTTVQQLVDDDWSVGDAVLSMAKPEKVDQLVHVDVVDR